MAMTQAEKAERFHRLHQPGQPLLMPNAWDLGSAALLAWLGFDALATTSSGDAATLGRLDGGVARREALAHGAAVAPGLATAQDIRSVVTSVDRPVSVLALAATPPVSELAALGVARVSVGGAFAFAALGTLWEAAQELREHGTYGYLERTATGVRAAR